MSLFVSLGNPKQASVRQGRCWFVLSPLEDQGPALIEDPLGTATNVTTSTHHTA